ncbi:GNAT family N-acetyltransferase [Devosia nitrariae]|uniref:N-acetyltransferase n=1 Tax=Devosia nitrariae TaxID=2071872 RepID=A0ABQ5W443_9HYPH|nr:GNAT family N-acetyltransferase [Devosia nitrariae]GLQ54569.1 N-acetyltransferase [Devosia nitrariae]
MKLETERLILRPWEEKDRDPFAAIVGNPHVMRFYTHPRSREEADAWFDRMVADLETGVTRLAAELKTDGSLLGLVGLASIDFEIPTNPKTEIGWVLGEAYWGKGYAPEAARACLDHAFTVLNLPEVVAFTTRTNLPSQRVMEKIGMVRDAGADFDHPKLPIGHPVRPHVLYRVINPRS